MNRPLDLSRDANILFASDSIADILGYQPHEIMGKSSFDYFHPDEVPFARSIHSRGVLLDKAAVLHYLRVQNRDGQWVSCECCFTVVHDVLVACTSIYRRGERSERELNRSDHPPCTVLSNPYQGGQLRRHRSVACSQARQETRVTTCWNIFRPNSRCRRWSASRGPP